MDGEGLGVIVRNYRRLPAAQLEQELASLTPATGRPRSGRPRAS
jgi:hypothetical protein